MLQQCSHARLELRQLSTTDHLLRSTWSTQTETHSHGAQFTIDGKHPFLSTIQAAWLVQQGSSKLAPREPMAFQSPVSGCIQESLLTVSRDTMARADCACTASCCPDLHGTSIPAMQECLKWFQMHSRSIPGRSARSSWCLMALPWMLLHAISLRAQFCTDMMQGHMLNHEML